MELGSTAICIGNFDGLHKGHRKLLDEFYARARKYNLKPILITFRPHPILFFHPHKRYLLSDYKKKVELIRSLYPQIEINITEFNKGLQSMQSLEYVNQIIKPKKPKLLCVGYDLKVGADKKLVREIVPQVLSDCEVLEISPVLDEDDKIISSSLIREKLSEGKVEAVTSYLERDFSMFGVVGTGKKLGREIGFPTLNIEIHQNIVAPKFGVYAVEVVLMDEKLKGIMNIGLNPTVSDSEDLKVEVHVLNFNRDVYGEMVEVRFKSFIREEKKFSGVEELKKQIARDVKEVEKYFAS
jgi:riboflavin kinase/FMN adenylyltransferase